MIINGREIGPGKPVYTIAEISANHNNDIKLAEELIHASAEAGADAIKMQTYTPDTLTIDCDRPCFKVGKGTQWEGRTLHDLYDEAYMPWDWQPQLMELANKLGMDCFSTPFDPTAVDFLSELNIPVFKVASFEVVDLPLLRKIGQTGKPVIMSTGMASLAEISDAVNTLRNAGCTDLCLLKCTSAYPATPDSMNLRTIPYLAEVFQVPAGLSDHTLGIAVPVTSVALGACVIEKHVTLSRGQEGPDSSFSMEPQEFREMVDAVRVAEQSLGRVQFEVSESEQPSRTFRRSLFVVKDVAKGEPFTEENVRSIRPGDGLSPKYYPEVLGRTAREEICRGTPLNWRDIA